MDKLQYYHEIPQKYLTFKILRKISSLTICRTIWKHQYTSKPIPITIFGLYTNIPLNILNKFCFFGSCQSIYYSPIDNGTYRQIIFQNVCLINIYATYLDEWFIGTNIFDNSEIITGRHICYNNINVKHTATTIFIGFNVEYFLSYYTEAIG